MNAPVSKTGKGLSVLREFESLPLRFFVFCPIARAVVSLQLRWGPRGSIGPAGDAEAMTLIASDPIFSRYGLDVLWN